MSRRRALHSALLVALVLGGRTAVAFNPPVARAGPLTVLIEGPAEVHRVGAPVTYRVRLENQGDEALKGTVELGLVDRWTASPAGAVAFEVGPKATAVREFAVSAGRGTYEALYPVHAVARFTAGGKEFTAHPILIVSAKVPPPVRPEPPASATPFRVPNDGRLALWQVPGRRGFVLVTGRAPRALPGSVTSDETTGVVLAVRDQTLDGGRRDVVAIHPPYRDGQVGSAVVEFPVELPSRGPVRLRFENAVVPEGKGDGVTFRVRVAPADAAAGQLGTVVFDRHTAAKRWGTSGEADLTSYAGRAVRIQLESDPGPKRDTGWDQSFWAEPTLVCGTPPAEPAFPRTRETGSRVLGTVRSAGAAYPVRIWPGSRGLLDTAVSLGDGPQAVQFRGFEVRVRGARLDDARSAVWLAGQQVEATPARYRVRHRFEGDLGPFDLVGELSVEAGCVRVRFRLENTPAPRPWQVVTLEDVALGPWSRGVRQVYAGAGNVVRGPEAFSLPFDGHRLSTSFVGLDFEGGPSVVQAVDVPPTSFDLRPGERHASLHTAHALTYTLIPAANAFQAARTWHDVNGLKPAGGVSNAAGRFVFDLWGGRYEETAAALRESFRYGLTDAMVVWHNWQRWGYDYRLPDIYPPNPEPGTEAQLKGLIDACKGAGVMFALHDNYIDFYPDADDFSYERNVAFHPDGRPVTAWLNEGRGAQSYRFRADRAAPYLKRNVGLIRNNLGPTAYFIDVWSSIGPYDYWTADGRFFDRVGARTTWGELFAWIRDALGGNAPQISESGHDQLIGWLDGAQTNHLRVGKPVPGRDGWTLWDWRCAGAERTPWFDAAHHDRFVLHGAGYPGRYEGGLDAREHGIDSDDYVATEVLTGHPGMVAQPFGRAVVRKYWLLHPLMKALALRRLASVDYEGGDLHRQHVRWDGGGETWVNRGTTDWTVGSRVLPPYGFYARARGDAGPVEAAVERRDGRVVEWGRSAEGEYVNGRLPVDGPSRVRPSVADFRGEGERGLAFTLRWDAEDPVPPGHRTFLHFCEADGSIAFQAQPEPDRFSPHSAGRVALRSQATLPPDARPGRVFELRAGLYDPKSGVRLALDAPEDGQSRVRLGLLRVVGRDGRVTGVAWEPQKGSAPSKPGPSHSPVRFDRVTTAGGLRLTRGPGELLVTPLPARQGRPFEVSLPASELPAAARSVRVEAVGSDGRVEAVIPSRRDALGLSWVCEPGVFQYRVRGG